MGRYDTRSGAHLQRSSGGSTRFDRSLRKKYGLPKAIGNHQNYWLWGPREYTGEIVIVLGSDGTGDREHFNSVEVVGRAQHPFSRLDEHFDIFLCRGLKSDLRSFWPQIKNWN